MAVRRERQILLSTLKAREAKPISLITRVMLRVVIWIAIATLTAVATVKFGRPSNGELVAIAASFLVGAATGIFAIVSEAKRRWPVVSQYIDFQRIEARLRELET